MNEQFIIQFEEWINLCVEFEESRDLSKKSITELRRYFSQLIDYIKDKSVTTIKDLSPSFFTDFLLQKATGENAPHIKALVWTLRKLGNFLFIKGIVESNPTSHLRHPKISKRAKIPEYLTESQIFDFLNAASKLPLMDFCMVSLLSTAGLRPHAITVLKWIDVLPEQRIIKLFMKGGWYKRMPLSNHMTDLLKQWSNKSEKKDPFVFVRKDSSCVSQEYIRKIVRETGENAHIPFRVTPRHLRHTFATFTADRHSKTITSALMGHSYTRTTDVYTHLAPTKFRRIMLSHPFQTYTHRGGYNG
jgi:site-specific recombinase XerD